jgi:hypothetical protein
LFRRLSGHWRELFAHLKENRSVPPKRELVLRRTRDDAAEVALNEAKALFEMELSGSGSLNARGTQLAGLTGATIALVATLADKWLNAAGGASRIWLGVLLIAAMVALFGSVYCALFAVLPTSRWRKVLADALSNDLAGTDPAAVQEDELSRSMAQAYLTMAEDQRVRNEAKADDMLLAYGFLSLGIVALLAAALIFVAVNIGTPSARHSDASWSRPSSTAPDHGSLRNFRRPPER